MRTVFDTPFGLFAVEAEGDAVTYLHFPDHIPDDFRADARPTPLLRQTQTEVREYLAGKRRTFTVPLNPRGGDFFRRVWARLFKTAYGELWTYGGMAKEVGNPRAARAVGMACRANPIPLIIPCHRIIGADGKLTGFSGGGLDLKRRLIALEKGGENP